MSANPNPLAASKGAAAYRMNSAAGGGPASAVVTVYQLALASLRGAIGKRDSGDRAGYFEGVGRAIDAVTELGNPLDEDAGATATGLASLYAYMNDRLLMASMAPNGGEAQEVIGLLETLLEAWRSISR